MQIVATDSPVLSESPSLTARFMWDRDEHRRLVRQITVHASKGKSARKTYLTLGAIWVVIVMIPILMGDWGGAKAVFPWLLVLAFWLGLFRFGTPWLAARSYRKQHPCVSDPFGVTLDGEGVRSTCSHSDVLIRWSGVRQAIETREFFLFFYSDRCAAYLPKRALTAPGELGRARELTLTHVALRDATKR
jgi:hypothetical protein